MGLPIVFSVVVLIGFGAVVLAPALVRIEDHKSTVADLRAKQQRLPNLRNQLRTSEQEHQLLQDQQQLLVDLIAGKDRIATFLALLEQEAEATGVSIERYEPLSPPPAAPPPSRRSSKSKAQTPAPAVDPIEALGYRRSSVSLGVRGGFGALQSFLRRMEALEIVVEASDLELTSTWTDDAKIQPITALGLRLSFFDRPAEGNPSSEPVKPG